MLTVARVWQQGPPALSDKLRSLAPSRSSTARFLAVAPQRSASASEHCARRRVAGGVALARLHLPAQRAALLSQHAPKRSHRPRVGLAVLCRAVCPQLPGEDVPGAGEEPSSIAAGGVCCVYAAGRMQPHGVTAGTALGSRRDGAARVPSAITNSSCSGHVFAFACLIFSTPFATLLPAPSLHLSLLFPILPVFFCFFSFCSSCLSRAAARGDGVMGSSGQWAACRGAFGSSPGSRQARGVRPGTCNHAPRAGAGAGGSRANLRHATCPHSRAQADVCLPAVPGDQPRSPAPGWHRGRRCHGAVLPCPRGAWVLTARRQGWCCFPGAARLPWCYRWDSEGG